MTRLDGVERRPSDPPIFWPPRLLGSPPSAHDSNSSSAPRFYFFPRQAGSHARRYSVAPPPLLSPAVSIAGPSRCYFPHPRPYHLFNRSDAPHTRVIPPPPAPRPCTFVCATSAWRVPARLQLVVCLEPVPPTYPLPLQLASRQRPQASQSRACRSAWFLSCSRLGHSQARHAKPLPPLEAGSASAPAGVPARPVSSSRRCRMYFSSSLYLRGEARRATFTAGTPRTSTPPAKRGACMRTPRGDPAQRAPGQRTHLYLAAVVERHYHIAPQPHSCMPSRTRSGGEDRRGAARARCRERGRWLLHVLAHTDHCTHTHCCT